MDSDRQTIAIRYTAALHSAIHAHPPEDALLWHQTGLYALAGTGRGGADRSGAVSESQPGYGGLSQCRVEGPQVSTLSRLRSCILFATFRVDRAGRGADFSGGGRTNSRFFLIDFCLPGIVMQEKLLSLQP